MTTFMAFQEKLLRFIDEFGEYRLDNSDHKLMRDCKQIAAPEMITRQMDFVKTIIG